MHDSLKVIYPTYKIVILNDMLDFGNKCDSIIMHPWSQNILATYFLLNYILLPTSAVCLKEMQCIAILTQSTRGAPKITIDAQMVFWQKKKRNGKFFAQTHRNIFLFGRNHRRVILNKFSPGILIIWELNVLRFS